jgi:hypothetical protein
MQASKRIFPTAFAVFAEYEHNMCHAWLFSALKQAELSRSIMLIRRKSHPAIQSAIEKR